MITTTEPAADTKPRKEAKAPKRFVQTNGGAVESDEPTRADELQDEFAAALKEVNAIEELRKGNLAPIETILVEHDHPIRVAPVFQAAVKDYDAATKAVEEWNKNKSEIEELEAEQFSLTRIRPSTIDDSKKSAKRLARIPNEIAAAKNKRGLAELAEMHLATLKHFFWELFGCEKPSQPDRKFRNGAVCRTPPAVQAALHACDCDPDAESWRDVLRPSDPRPKRKVVVAGFGRATDRNRSPGTY